ncbi:apoptosis-associated speck-like protein containing a CARD isoform X2 [Acanthopagrus latus]|uniref:apoptosis-associated speck-like protein containing a CARD isoform X2 n=1 Tax=Acanthopagrus latus TaxID=8177 RepID=UPI00187CB6BA|nr:apoptosis-associated speck-like protein containing a CARD isoform X2 [Acanthopagrus latus]
MPPKTIKKAIKNCLENLREKDFKKFCDALIADAGIATSRVEGKDFLDVTNVVVTNFGEAKALDMVIDLLEDNGCKEQADALVAETKELTSKAGSSKSAGASTGTDRVTPKADGERFVDRYREDLIQRVKTIPQILDQLLTKKVIDQETYDKIRVMRPPQEQMREIYKSLNARACKDIFYEILEEKEKWLIEDLKKN